MAMANVASVVVLPEPSGPTRTTSPGPAAIAAANSSHVRNHAANAAGGNVGLVAGVLDTTDDSLNG